MREPDENLVLARAKLNFACKSHGERCWDGIFSDNVKTYGRPVLVLSENERAEFLEQARHELRHESGDA
ncbi:hypothetical protein G3T14_06335 [Methylobacterium sp. BTF04]|uniref:hypothetical protein n=1 Tax=Methylobacterium sp. BTF04 TaxID=2708300 RepID=UPI0013D530EB|nr:hypothetical protein [Methylobacterium sp. BTF04]NEU11748.1 hypothetical protein [Methylobacterium sp. BTF04]